MKIPLQKYWDVQKKYLAPFKFRVLLLGVLLGSGTILLIISPLVVERFIFLATNGHPLQDPNLYWTTTQFGFVNIGNIFRALLILAAVYIVLMVIQQLITLASVYLSQNL